MIRLLALLAVAGCAAPAVLPVVPIPLRNPTAPIASQADVTMARLSGDWIVVQGAGIAPGTRLSFGADAVRIGGGSVPLKSATPGRMHLGDEVIWVHWIDADNRTAALGNPDGGRVWVMDRAGKPGERLRAAREILSWYGYDLSRME